PLEERVVITPQPPLRIRFPQPEKELIVHGRIPVLIALSVCGSKIRSLLEQQNVIASLGQQPRDRPPAAATAYNDDVMLLCHHDPPRACTRAVCPCEDRLDRADNRLDGCFGCLHAVVVIALTNVWTAVSASFTLYL